MKQIILGDTHGRAYWTQVLEKEQTWDRVIFIGDYFDTHEDILPIEQLNNFENICRFKRENKQGEIILLIGNHDYHYFPGIEEYGVSGYQPRMRTSFEGALSENNKLLQMCFVDEYDTVYTHAGLTKTFVKNHIGSFSEKVINDVWKYKPRTFNFYLWDSSGCGDNINQSCIWVRPQSLYQDSINKYQVVGHTSVKNIVVDKEKNPHFILIDAIGNGYYLVRENEKFEARSL